MIYKTEVIFVSGHSKWANIKRKKGAADAQKGKVFTKLGKEIQIAVRDGGPNPDNNAKLKDVIAKAKAANMPNDNIQRSIKKASGEGGSDNIEEMQYEGYGPGGVAIIVSVVTDNRNRTAADVRHLLINSAETWALQAVYPLCSTRKVLSLWKTTAPLTRKHL